MNIYVKARDDDPIWHDVVLPIWRDHLWPGRKSEIRPWNDIHNELPSPARVTFFVAEDETGKVLGVNSGFRTSDSKYRSRGIYVFPEYRRHGVAEALMARTEREALDQGCNVLWSMPRKPAIEFYESFGFKRVSDWDETSYEFGPNCFVEKPISRYGNFIRPFEADRVELSHNNHFKFGYNGEWFNYRKDYRDKWQVQYGRCDRPSGDFRQECQRTAELIRSKTDLPIQVMFSGGADSEIVMRAFADARIPVTAAIMLFRHGVNEHDTRYAIDYCTATNTAYELIDLDLGWFFADHSEVYNYADQTYSLSPQLCTTMWLADQLDGYPILGQGECYLAKRVPDGYVAGETPYEPSGWDLFEREKIAAWYRHFMVRRQSACPGFFQYTPEIMHAFLKDPLVVDLVNDRMPGKLSTLSSKLRIYQRYYPLTPRKKYNGFEKVEEEDAKIRKVLIERNPAAGEIQKTPYEDVIKQLEYQPPSFNPKPRVQSVIPFIIPVEARQLEIVDFDDVMDLIEHTYQFEENSSFERDKFRYEKILKEWYLQGVTHKMFGTFKGTVLRSMVGMRLDLPIAGAWALSNLRTCMTDPVHKSVLRPTLIRLYQEAENLGLKQYFTCMRRDRFKPFHRLFMMAAPEYYGKYRHEEHLVVPAQSRPEEDLWWGMMGRRYWTHDVIIKRAYLET